MKKSFGLFLKEEKVVWEQWVIPVLVNTSPRPTEDDETSGERDGRCETTACAFRQLNQAHADVSLWWRGVLVEFGGGGGP